MNNIIMMYHYVRDNSSLKCFSTNQFRNQINYLKSKYEILTLTEALDYHGRKKTCVLTFDDGLLDSKKNILPILLGLQIKGVFFISTSILENNKILDVQKRHFLLSNIGSELLVNELNSMLPEELKIKADPIFKTDYLDDLLTCSMKWMLDFGDYEIINPILTNIFNKYIGNEDKVFDDLYLARDDLQELLRYGMEIGIHGHSHRQLGIMYFKDQEYEIKKSQSLIRKIISDRPLYFSYPLGSYNPITVRLLQKYNYEAALTINKHKNNEYTNLFELGRFDCIDKNSF